jgi:hypothetical protein
MVDFVAIVRSDYFRISFAILTAVGAPFGFPATKLSR